MSISRSRRLLLAIIFGFSVACSADETPGVVGIFYEQRSDVIASGVNAGVTDPEGMFSAGLMMNGFRWADSVSMQRRPEGAAFAYLGVSLPYPVSPYVEFGYSPIGLLVLMATADKNTASGTDVTNQEPWDSFLTLGLRMRFGQWGSFRLYHRWYEVFHYDSQTATDIQTDFHVWGSALNIFF